MKKRKILLILLFVIGLFTFDLEFLNKNKAWCSEEVYLRGLPLQIYEYRSDEYAYPTNFIEMYNYGFYKNGDDYYIKFDVTIKETNSVGDPFYNITQNTIMLNFIDSNRYGTCVKNGRNVIATIPVYKTDIERNVYGPKLLFSVTARYLHSSYDYEFLAYLPDDFTFTEEWFNQKPKVEILKPTNNDWLN